MRLAWHALAQAGQAALYMTAAAAADWPQARTGACQPCPALPALGWSALLAAAVNTRPAAGCPCSRALYLHHGFTDFKKVQVRLMAAGAVDGS